MKCVVHDCDMEWMRSEAHPDGGSWFCADCFADEEAQYVDNDDEYLDNPNHIMGMMREIEGTVCEFDYGARGRMRHARMTTGKHGLRRPK